MKTLYELFPSGKWKELLSVAMKAPTFQELSSFVETEAGKDLIYPKYENIFKAFEFTPFDEVKVCILGQDPYPNENQAHGLSFSVMPTVPAPRSLNNIFKELQSDLGTPRAQHGNLERWAKQGVLLLNTVLTVEKQNAGSHSKRGWEEFTDQVISHLSRNKSGVVFFLWGKPSAKKRPMIDESKHLVIESAHPSPLSASRGFFGSRPFSRANTYLEQMGRTKIEW